MDLNLNTCLHRLTLWLEDCCQNHPGCSYPLDARLPKRLLDVSTLKTGCIQLVGCSAILSTRYIALSHCWGEAQTITTRMSNFEHH